MDKKTVKKRKNFTLDIYGQEYSVEYVDAVFHPSNGQECCGLCDSEASKIFISRNIDDSIVPVTLLHELFHAYARRMGMENSGMSHELEEILADQFGKLLTENFDFEF